MSLNITVAPLEYAKSVTKTELRKTIKAIKVMEYDEFADRCRICFEKYLVGDMEQAEWWSRHAESIKPE